MISQPYGYLAAGAPVGRVEMAPRQAIAGQGIGIIHIEQVWYPMLPGNVVNAHTFDFPVRLKPVSGLDIASLFGPDSMDVFEPVLAACLALQDEGVRAISGACGFFGRYQQRIAAELEIPVALSSLVQLPWLRAVRPGRRIAVLTADATAFDAELLAGCGILDSHDLVVGGLQDAPEFSAILTGRGSFDNEVVQAEVVGLARELCSDPQVGSVLLECSDLPPYAAAIQAAVGRPVFDFTTVIRWLHNGTAQRPYGGWI